MSATGADVTLPAELLTVTVIAAPLSAMNAAGIAYVPVVAPTIGVLLLFHW